MTNIIVFVAIQDVPVKIFSNTLVYFFLNTGVLYLFEKIHRFDRAVFLFCLDTMKFIALITVMLLFTNPMQTQNHIPALLYCGNFFIFQTALILSITQAEK